MTYSPLINNSNQVSTMDELESRLKALESEIALRRSNYQAIIKVYNEVSAKKDFMREKIYKLEKQRDAIIQGQLDFDSDL